MIKVVLIFFLNLPLLVFGQNRESNQNTSVPLEGYISDYEIIKLTSGPKQHWFGYYDKLQVDPTGRYVLVAEVDTIHRSPTENDGLIIGMIDLHDNNKWIPLGESHAWGWQQGCMLQWIPGSKEEILWNDLEDGKFVTRILNVFTKERRTLPKAIYTLSNDGTFALGTEFNRIQKLRPGYGYAGVPDPYEENRHPGEIGLYKIDLKTGHSELLITIDAMAKEEHQGEDLTDYWHWFNHILISPDDQRFTFLHRWRKEKGNGKDKAASGFITRMVTADLDGSNRYILDPSGYTSHFIWKNPKEICMWTKPIGKDNGFYTFTDKTNKIVPVGEGIMTVNGHNTYINGTNEEWILNDTYPQGAERLQELYLYHVPTKKKISLGKFHEPLKYKGEVRCDLHPRNSPDGHLVFFDSTHGGDGRQLYMIDVSKIIE
ncbi:hypothetical protein [uncultured Kriegella sp.]|uniref:hypothetical protein n=1 Tax=uncultured Kriegella sp. TaxID=1798910 RepID=UPI0030DA341C|tara:strand:+ start:150455 stop:151744 length:1290 start_codon:yes stop_codon:yes gene_type:complete